MYTSTQVEDINEDIRTCTEARDRIAAGRSREDFQDFVDRRDRREIGARSARDRHAFATCASGAARHASITYSTRTTRRVHSYPPRATYMPPTCPPTHSPPSLLRTVQIDAIPRRRDDDALCGDDRRSHLLGDCAAVRRAETDGDGEPPHQVSSDAS